MQHQKKNDKVWQPNRHAHDNVKHTEKEHLLIQEKEIVLVIQQTIVPNINSHSDQLKPLNTIETTELHLLDFVQTHFMHICRKDIYSSYPQWNYYVSSLAETKAY